MKPTLLLLAIGLTLQSCAQEVGVQLYSFRNQFKTDIPGTLDKVQKMGLRTLEGGDSYGLSHAEFKKMLDEKNMKVVSVGADFGKLETDLQSVIGNAKMYGAKYVVCFWIPHKDGNFTLEDARKGVEVFNNAGRILKEKGLTLCYHPHGYEFVPWEGATLYDYILTKTNPAYLSIEMDVFWIKHPGQDPVALLKKYSGRYKLMHLKDRAHGTPNTQNGHADVETNVVLGKGDVGIAEIMKVARKHGVKYFFIEDESSRSLEQVPQSLEFLRSLKH